MHPKRKKRLLLILFLVASVGTAVGLVMYSLSQNINAFMSPTEIRDGKATVGETIRAGGLVEPGTVKRAQDGLLVHFVITDGQSEVTVEYDGILPDLFREGQGIVALGHLREDGVFVASQVLAKHDENYMPPEVKDALDKAHKQGKENLESARY